MPQFMLKPFLLGFAIGLVLFGVPCFFWLRARYRAHRKFIQDWDAATLRAGWDKSTDSPQLRVERNRTMFRGRLG